MSGYDRVLALQSAEANEWRADYLEDEAREARAVARATRREHGLPATPAPRGTIPTHAALEWPCAT